MPGQIQDFPKGGVGAAASTTEVAVLSVPPVPADNTVPKAGENTFSFPLPAQRSKLNQISVTMCPC